jgi:hypothetical protein
VSRLINVVAVLGAIVLVLSVLVSMRGAFPVSFRLLELVAAITVLGCVIANMVLYAKERRNRS